MARRRPDSRITLTVSEVIHIVRAVVLLGLLVAATVVLLARADHGTVPEVVFRVLVHSTLKL